MTMLSFQSPDCTLTLEEGLRDYYASRDDLVGGRGISDQARDFFRCHDVAHVVFGCSTSLTNEAMVKIWSFFGTTGGLSLARDYRLVEAQEIYEQIPWTEVPKTALRSTVIVPKVLARCRRMHAKWPWTKHAAYMTKPLAEIRRDFGIDVLVVP